MLEQGELVVDDVHAGGPGCGLADDGPDPDHGQPVFASQLAVVGSVELGADGTVAGSPADLVHLGDIDALTAAGLDQLQRWFQADGLGDVPEIWWKIVELDVVLINH